MIQIEILNDTLKRTYSDINLMIIQVSTGNIYEEAVDLIDSTFEYIESDIPIMQFDAQVDLPDLQEQVVHQVLQEQVDLPVLQEPQE